MNKQNKTNNQRHESTIDNYFEKTSKGFDVWVEEKMRIEAICRLQQSKLEIRTKKVVPATTSLYLTAVIPDSSQMDFSKI